MANIGDKYIIEITEEYTSGNGVDRKKRYKFKNIGNVLIAEGNLNKLEKVEDVYKRAFNEGLNHGWKLVEEVAKTTFEQRKEIFGTDDNIVDLAKKFDAADAFELLSKWKTSEESKRLKERLVKNLNAIKEKWDNINAGDEIYVFENNENYVVTKDYEEALSVVSRDGNAFIMNKKFYTFRKTGKHYGDIEDIIKCLGERKEMPRGQV